MYGMCVCLLMAAVLSACMLHTLHALIHIIGRRWNCIYRGTCANRMAVYAQPTPWYTSKIHSKGMYIFALICTQNIVSLWQTHINECPFCALFLILHCNFPLFNARMREREFEIKKRAIGKCKQMLFFFSIELLCQSILLSFRLSFLCH